MRVLLLLEVVIFGWKIEGGSMRGFIAAAEAKEWRWRRRYKDSKKVVLLE